MDNKLKKIERRLEKLYRVQKQLEKKRKKLTKVATKSKKKAVANSKKLAAAKVPVKVAVKTGTKKKKLLGIVGVSIGLAVVSTIAAVLVTKLIQRASVQKNAGNRNAYEESADGPANAGNSDYEKASLEELEEALLKVENQLDEVTAAIEKTKN